MLNLNNQVTFLTSYNPQQPWSLSSSIIYHFTKFPTSPKGYEKIIQTCKYFFIKNPVIVIPRLFLKHNKNKWHITFNGKLIYLNDLKSKKSWITDEIYVQNWLNKGNIQYFSNFIVPKIYQSNAKKLILFNQTISINDLKFLGSECEIIWFDKNTVINENGTAAKMEKIFEILTNVSELYYVLGDNSSEAIITEETAQILPKLPNFSNLKYFDLLNIPESFDIEYFYEYIKENRKTKIRLEFNLQISDAFKNRILATVNKILETKNYNFKPPFISFHGMNQSLSDKLRKLFFQH